MPERYGVGVIVEIFGIANCDSVKKARAWLEASGRDYRFHDYKREGVDPARLARWAQEAGWERLLNTRGTTFHKLSDEDRSGIDEGKALALMVAHPSLIKRPVLEFARRDDDIGLLIGFDPAGWSAALG